MEFQHDRSWETFTSILSSVLTAREAWTRFIEFHERLHPKTYWVRLKEIEIEEEQASIVEWFTALAIRNPVPKEIVAFWIGLFKMAGEEENGIPTIYFGGADNYDIDDEDWKCDLAYLPDNRYAQPGLLQEIDLIAQEDDDNYEFLDWILPLAYCAFTFDEVVRTKIDKSLFLQHKDKLFMAVGHDSGDSVTLSPITK